MKKFIFALALLCTLQAHAFVGERPIDGWKADLAKVIDAEHAILDHIPIHPNRKIVLCMIYPSQHYVAYKTRLSEDKTKILSYVHLKYEIAKKYFPWIKSHKKAYLEPLKGSEYRFPKEKAPEKPEVLHDDSPSDDNVDDQPEPDIAE